VTVVEVRDVEPSRDGAWLQAHLDDHFGGALQARGGELVDVRTLPALVAEQHGERVGVLCYRPDGDGVWELALISAAVRHDGVGSALLAALVERIGPGQRLWLVTTNDNVDALRFYQRRGFRLRAVRSGAVDAARRDLKPQIPPIGDYGIPLRDELELDLST
jgi:ribosomal protein S18 acetylase RimI-like enzyme